MPHASPIRSSRPTPAEALRRALSAAALLGSTWSLAAPPAVLPVQAEQIKRLGLQTAHAQPAGSAGRLLLQGQVVLPPPLLRVISAPLPALVEQTQVARGDTLKAGQALLTLNAPQLIERQRAYRQARLQVDLARQTAERDAALLREGIIPGARAQASQNQLALAEAALREQAQLLQLAGARPSRDLSGRLQLDAPAAGSVVEVLVQPGQQVEAGAPLLKFARTGALWIELQASAEAARRLRVGDVVQLPGCAMPARLASINAHIDAATQTQALRAQWPQANDCATPGQRVQAEVLPADAPAADRAGSWLIPSAAVVRHAGRDIVFVQRPNGFVPVPVRVLGQVQDSGPSASGGATLSQIAPQPPAQLAADDAVVVRGAVALKGMLQGLGGE